MRSFAAATVLGLSACSGAKYLKDVELGPVPVDATYYRPEQVTAGNESSFAPDLSPNGAFVFYTSDREGDKDIWEKRSAGGFANQITFHSADDFAPVLDPSGKKLAFVSRREDAAGDIHIVHLGLRWNALWTAADDKAKVVRSPATEDSNPSWYPDGEHIVFSARRPGEKVSQIMKASLSELKAEPLGEAFGDQPSVSPDGQKVAFVREGAIYLYAEGDQTIAQITQGGLLQDGQPRFSQDGRALVFNRYADDTNSDGKLDGNDRPTVWKLELASQRGAKIRENYQIVPLTSAEFSAFSPQLRPPYLYVALQTSEGLDIFRLPETGQVNVGEDLVAIWKQLETMPSYHAKTYLLRRAAAEMMRRGRDELAAEVALLELNWLVQNRRFTEAAWAHEKLKQNFTSQLALSAEADLAMIELGIAPISYPSFTVELTAEQEAKLKDAVRAAEQTAAPFSRQDPAGRRVQGRAVLVKAKALASLRKFFDAADTLAAARGHFADDRALSAEIALYEAAITPAMTSVEGAVERYQAIAKNFPENRDIIRRASQQVIQLLEKMPDRTERLVALRTSARGLTIMPALAHMRIAEHFLAEGKEAVSANELREIVDSYPESPEIVLEAAERLSQYEEKVGRYEAAEGMLVAVDARMAQGRTDLASRARRLLVDFYNRLGSVLLGANDAPAAIKEYRKAIALESLDVAAHRGLIDASYKRGTLDELKNAYEKSANDYPTSAERRYFYAYALTYDIDEADSVRGRIRAINHAIDETLAARSLNGQILHIHQTLGWLDMQLGYWSERFHDGSSILGALDKRYGMVKTFFGLGDPNWVQAGIDSLQQAYFLSKDDSLERAALSQNLGQAFYELKNYPKALDYYSRRIRLLPVIPVRDPRAEAFLWRRAGRAAFQIEELDLAEALQRKALGSWERVGDDREIAYSVDALALTLRERGDCQEASVLYERLLGINRRLDDKPNIIGSLSSLGYCAFQRQKFDEALAWFDEAEAELAGAHQTNADVKRAADDKGGLAVDLGGGASAAKGFDLFSRLNLIVSFKAKIYEKLARPDLALIALERKLTLLKVQREELLDQKAPDTALAEELAIVENNIGAMLLAAGRHRDARSSFASATDTAKLLRPESQTHLTHHELTNRINYARIQLRLAQLDAVPDPDLDRLVQDLDQEAQSLEAKWLEGAKVEGKPLAQLVGLAASLRASQKDDIDRAKVASGLQKAAKIMAKAEPGPTARRGPMLAAVATLHGRAEADGKLAALMGELASAAARTPSVSWKVAAAEGHWQRSYEELTRYVQAGGTLRTAGDRRAARLIFEKILGSGSTPLDERSLQLRRYLILKMIDLAARTLGEETFVDVERGSEAASAGAQNPSSEPARSLARQRKYLLPPSLLGHLVVKDEAQLRAALRPGEAMLVVHKALDGRLAAHLYTSERRVDAYGQLVQGGDVEAAIATLLDQSQLAKQLPAAGARLYLVPVAELYDQAWEKMPVAGSALGTRALSFLPSPDLLPDYVAKRRLPKALLGHVSWPNFSPEPAADGIPKPVPPPDDPAAPETARLIAKANFAREYLRIVPDGKATIARAFATQDLIHIDAPLTLNDIEPAHSILHATTNERAKDYVNDLTIRQLAKLKLDQSTMLAFARVERSAREFQTQGEASDGWAALSLAAASAGVATVVVGERSLPIDGSKPPEESFREGDEEEEEEEESKDAAVASATSTAPQLAASGSASTQAASAPPPPRPKRLPKRTLTPEASLALAALYQPWQAFYQNLEKLPFAEAAQRASLPARVLGYGGVPADEEKAFATQNLAATVDEAEEAWDEKDFVTAAAAYKRALAYASLLGQEGQIDEFLDRIVKSLFQRRDYLAALAFQRRIAERAKPKGKDQESDPVDYANAVIDTAVLAVRAYQFSEAEALLTEAEKILAEEGEDRLLGKVWHYRGINLENQKRYHETIAAYEKSRAFFATSNPDEATLRLLDIGTVYGFKLSNYVKALDYYNLAIAAFKQKGAQASAVQVEIDKANALMTIGDLQQAMALLERDVIPAIDKEQQRILWVRATQILANAYFRAGMYRQALELNDKNLLEIKKIEPEATRVSRELDSANLRAILLGKIGNPKESFAIFREAIETAEEFANKGAMSLLYSNYGFWMREYGHVDQAIEFTNIALKIDQELASRSSIAYDQRNLGLAIIIKGDYNRARALLTESLRTSEELYLSHNIAYCHFGLGDVALREEKWQEAEAHFRRALTTSEQGFLMDFVWRAYAGIATAFLRQEKLADAERNFAKASGLLERLRAGLKSEASPNQFINDIGVQEVYEAYAQLLMQLGRSEEAWLAAEKSRSRAFLDSIGTQKLAFARQESVRLVAEEKNAKSRVETAERQLAQAKQEKSADLEALSKAWHEAQKDHDELLQTMRQVEKQLVSLVAVETISKEELSSLVPRDTAVVSYLMTAEKLLAWVIRDGKIDGVATTIKRQDLIARVRDFRTVTQNYSTTSYLGRELAQVLLDPIVPFLKETKRLAIVPHQSLHFLPFAALPLDDGYLIDHFALYYLDSATMARYTHQPGKKAKINAQSKIVAFANPSFQPPARDLPFAEKEVAVLGRYFDQVSSHLGAAARKETFLAEAPRAEVLHLATHGEFLPSAPASSRLLLTKDGTLENGDLTVTDIFAMPPVATDMVTLSACESGLGKLSPADEIIGMNRAFLFTGANTVVSSLWRISDVASAVTMKRFYRYLAEGDDKAEAMRKSQILVRRYYRHPAYWSSFRVVGSYL